mmetsp:Transcript_106203/g.266010  ORF Transcript_106203/g.266010 Transcript_106203/m.266010 type:complete len:306 (-) Transcript_106203:252-1169(-)
MATPAARTRARSCASPPSSKKLPPALQLRGRMQPGCSASPSNLGHLIGPSASQLASVRSHAQSAPWGLQHARAQASDDGDCGSAGLARDPMHCAVDLLEVAVGLAYVSGDMAAASSACAHIGGQSLRSTACAQLAAYTLWRLGASVLESVVAHHWCPNPTTTGAVLTCNKAVAQVVFNAADAMRWAHAAIKRCKVTGQATRWQSQMSSRVSAWSGGIMAPLGNATKALQDAMASASTARVPGAVRKFVRAVNTSLGSLDADMRQVSTVDVRPASFVQQLQLHFARLPSAVAAAVKAGATLFKPSS